MNATETILWLNDRDPFHEWAVDDDIFCLHCDGVFKAQDVARDADYPTCPVCHDSSPLDFANMPWWREDLVNQRVTKHEMVNTWRLKPIQAIRGKPFCLPKPESYEAN